MGTHDVIALSGLSARGFHGVFEHERREGQTFVVDAVLHVDTGPAAASDDLADTVDYGALASRLVAVVEGEPVRLLERLAERLADACLADRRVTAAEVTVHKPEAPIEATFGDVAVTIQRSAAVTGRRAVVALGSNVGDRLGQLQRGLALLAAHDDVSVLCVSAVYETAPVGGPAEQEPYLNAVAVVEVSMRPADLLGLLHVVEAAAGRTREVRWGPRTLDLDLLDYEHVTARDPQLMLPHPRAHERGFVLWPWADADPTATLPGFGPVADLARSVGADGVVRRDDLVLAVPR